MGDWFDSFVEENKSSLQVITRSAFSIYKKPSKFYEYLINALAVDLEEKRSGAETRYLALKKENFIQSDIEDLFMRSARKSDHAQRAQKKIKDFFKPKAATCATEVKVEITVKEEPVVEVSDSDTETTTNNEDEVSSSLPGQKDLLKLCNLLGVKKGQFMKDEEGSNLVIFSKRVGPKLEVFQNLVGLVDQNAVYFQGNSQFSNRRENTENVLNETREILENLVQNYVLLEDDMDKMSASERRKMVDFCKSNISEGKQQLSKVLDRLYNCLEEMNRKLKKRMSHIKVAKTSAGKLKIVSKNSDKNWEECIEKIEEQGEGLYNFKVEDFEQAQHYFDWLGRNGHEFCYTENVLKRLNKPNEQKKFVERVLVEKMPVVKLILRGKKSVLVDADTLFSSPRLICDLMKMSKKEEGCSEPAPPVMSRLEKKRKPGSGRTAFHKKRPDIVEAIKVFASNTGVGAQIRRRSEVGSMGFNISDVKEFVTDKFFPDNPKKAPGESTLRRLFCASHKNHKAAKRYKGLIKAKPCRKRNDATVGSAHEHRRHCFTMVKIAREFASKHFEEVVCNSADDKCKVPLGPPTVNRLTSINKFFMESDSPNLPDHDIRSGETIVPSGYMFLQFKDGLCLDFRPTASETAMAEQDEDKNEENATELDERLEDALREFQKSIEYDEIGNVVEQNNNVSDESFEPANDQHEAATETVVPLCFCSTTSHKCSQCQKKVCNFCSPNGEDDDRKCKPCFQIPQVDGMFSDSDSYDDSDDDVVVNKQNNRMVIRDDEAVDMENNEQDEQ